MRGVNVRGRKIPHQFSYPMTRCKLVEETYPPNETPAASDPTIAGEHTSHIQTAAHDSDRIFIAMPEVPPIEYDCVCGFILLSVCQRST
jgi:hypothetical protein